MSLSHCYFKLNGSLRNEINLNLQVFDYLEPVALSCFGKLFSQNSQENTCVRLSFLKKKPRHRYFPVSFVNTSFIRTPPLADSYCSCHQTTVLFKAAIDYHNHRTHVFTFIRMFHQIYFLSVNLAFFIIIRELLLGLIFLIFLLLTILY